MIFRFSLRSMLLFTAVMAIATVVVQVRGDVFSNFFLGALTGLVAVGLVQQILNPGDTDKTTLSQRNLRRGCLLSILFCLGIAVYFSVNLLLVADPYLIGSRQYQDPEFKGMEPLWMFCLFLGSITAPWMSRPRVASATNRSRTAIISMAVTVFLCAYLFVVIRNVTEAVGLTDIAINEVETSLAQPTATQSPEYVEWFGRKPEEFKRFLSVQYRSWPMLAVSTLCIVLACRRNLNWLVTVVLVVASVLLALPSALNLDWLVRGEAEKLFPILLPNGLNQLGGQWMVVFCGALMLTLYAATRNDRSVKVGVPQQTESRFATDSAFLGILMILAGVSGFISAIGDYRYLFSESDESHIAFLLPAYIFAEYFLWPAAAVCKDAILYPHHMLQLWLFPCGVHWLWRRHKYSADGCGERWPQIGAHQVLLAPLLFALTVLFIAASVPFGIALLHQPI